MKREIRQIRGIIMVLCLILVAVLLLSETVFAAHQHYSGDDEHCVLCMLSSREELAFALPICAFIAVLLSMSLNFAKTAITAKSSLVSRKVKLND